MAGPARQAELLIASEVDEDAAQQVVDMFDGFGLKTVGRRRLAHRGPMELEWLVLAALPLHAFLSGLGSEAVTALVAGVKRLDRQRRKDGNAAGVPLVLHDEQSGIRVIVEAELPAAAYEQLVALDLTRYRKGPLHYDRDRGKWRSELDEAAG